MTESIQIITALSLVYTCIEFEFVMIFKPFRHVYVLYFTTYDCAVEWNYLGITKTTYCICNVNVLHVWKKIKD